SLLRQLYDKDSAIREFAWGTFVSRYGPGIHDLLRRHGLQVADAENVTQKGLENIWRAIERFQRKRNGSFRTWLKAIIRNAWCDFIQSPERRLQCAGEQVDAWLGSQAAPEEVADLLERQEDLRERIENVLEQLREEFNPTNLAAFRMTYLE